jgi:hypothetical protein
MFSLYGIANASIVFVFVTPQYTCSRNTVKVGFKHQSINQSSLENMSCYSMMTCLPSPNYSGEILSVQIWIRSKSGSVLNVSSIFICVLDSVCISQMMTWYGSKVTSGLRVFIACQSV